MAEYATKMIVWYDGESHRYVVDTCWNDGPATETNRVETHGHALAIARTESRRWDDVPIEDQSERPYRMVV